MSSVPRWYLPVVVLALLWNVLGCIAYLADVTVTPEEVAAMSAAQQALYAARTPWMVAATAVAVWGGAAGCLGLFLRRRWALPVLVASLAGVIVQDAGILMVQGGAAFAGTASLLQGLVLVVAVALVFLARRAIAEGWMDRPAQAPVPGPPTMAP